MRGEWIEISMMGWGGRNNKSLPMRGEWIEIEPVSPSGFYQLCLSPCGESGLKSFPRASPRLPHLSLPMRGEWIEMPEIVPVILAELSLPMRGEWIEIAGWIPT